MGIWLTNKQSNAIPGGWQVSPDYLQRQTVSPACGKVLDSDLLIARSLALAPE